MSDYHENDAMIWLELILQEFIDTCDMHVWIKMNKNDKRDKERKKKLLVSFWSSEVSSSFEDVVAWRFRQRFVMASSPKEFLRFFGYSRGFLSRTQALDVEILLTSVLDVSLLL